MSDEEKQGDDAPRNWPTIVEQQAHWDRTLPNDYQDWIKQGDDHGGNWTPDKCEANYDRYDKEGHPFA